jgi:PIN domain nuclease of toxin-antitoxin system
MVGWRPAIVIEARRAMANQSNTILVSAASAWEITTKARLGKLPGAADVSLTSPRAWPV